jgi:hypothetical protein
MSHFPWCIIATAEAAGTATTMTTSFAMAVEPRRRLLRRRRRREICHGRRCTSLHRDRGLIIRNNYSNDDCDDIFNLILRNLDDSSTDDGNNNSSSNNNNNRRSFLHSALSVGSFISTTTASPYRANAAKGAAEYDLEYYLRDIFMGNKPEGNLPASSSASSSIPSRLPRTLRGSFLVNNLLDDELESCIPLQELFKITTTTPISSLVQDITTLRGKVQSAFQASHPWQVESVKDEYYFDLTCYAIWKIASNVIPKDYEKRNIFARNIGRKALDALILPSGKDDKFVGLSGKSVEALRTRSSSSGDSSGSSDGESTKSTSLTNSVPVIIDILNLFQSSGYCSGYRIGGDDASSNNNYDSRRTAAATTTTTANVIFDNLDDEELSTRGGSINCLVSIYDPATLGSALQITGEGSRFVPDFVGTTLAAAWERMLNGHDDNGGDVVVTYESYFVDPIYRPNPKVSSRLMYRCSHQ